MSGYGLCPNCGGRKTRQVHLDVMRDSVERVFVCEDCPTEFVVVYTNPEIMDVYTYPEGDDDE